jgi:flagellum-specific peptidoglycan hydrolase FlgJ
MSKNLPLIASAALAAQKATGCPGLLLIAQCALETGWLNSAPNNNCFGIKEYEGCYGRQLLRTIEWFNDSELRWFLSKADGRTAEVAQGATFIGHAGRRKYAVQDWFATFESLGDCFAKRASLFATGRYAFAATKFKVDSDLNALIHAIAPIYATDPHYAESVLAIVNQPDVQAAWKAQALFLGEIT